MTQSLLTGAFLLEELAFLAVFCVDVYTVLGWK